MASSQEGLSPRLWPDRVWMDTPTNLADGPAWELRTPWGPVTSERVAATSGPVISLVVASVSVVLGLMVSWRGEVHESAAGFWPPAGVALVALMVVPPRRWGWVLAAVATPTLLGMATGVVEVGSGVWWAVGNVAEPLFSASLLTLFAQSRWMTRFRLFVVFWAIGVIIGPMVGGAIGMIGTIVEFDEPWFEVWIHWVITDGLGVLIVMPMLLTLTPHKPLPRGGSEIATLLLLILTLSGLAFADIGADGAVFLPYLMLVCLVWAGFRFTTRGVAVAGFVVALAANLAIAYDVGPFAESSHVTARLTLPIFLMMAVGTGLLVALLASDLANRQEVETLLTHRATHDDLTTLPNRLLFANQLDWAMTRPAEDQQGLTVFLVDLADFKKINDRHGHLVGDVVLREVARRLRSTLPDDDLLARFGGDQFVAMCHCLGGRDDADGMAQALTAALEPDMEVDSGELYSMSCTIGIVMAADGDHQTSTDLLRSADIALNHAKRADKQRAFYDDQLEAQTRRRLEIANEFQGAVARGEISLVYQPQISMRTGRVREFEALARWTSPRLGPVGPDEFVVVAERTGMVGPFGDFVIEEACRQLVQWRAAHPDSPHLRVAVNVSARQLCDVAFPARVAAILDRTALPSHALTFEITETAMMDDLDVTARVLAQLRDLGLRLAMDDFGTGFSSMTNLRLVELDSLKIDRSFINGLGDDPQDTAIVRSVINLGHSFGLKVVAEGVETEEQASELIRLGCDDGQGYLWSRPVPPAEATELIDRSFPLPTPAPTANFTTKRVPPLGDTPIRRSAR